MRSFKLKRIIRRNTTINMIMYYTTLIIIGIMLFAVIYSLLDRETSVLSFRDYYFRA